MKRAVTVAILATLLILSRGNQTARAATCESLTSLSLPEASVSLAETVPAGGFSPPGSTQRISNLPAFCRVAATLRPSGDSNIKIEVWMPISNWNGKYQAVGNGGWAGSIVYAGMAEALRRGYATSSTDTGHVGGTARDTLGSQEKLIDFSYRSIHEMALKAKSIIREFYTSDPQQSYFVGCSTGGRQALLEAQRYPTDFNGIIAGAPALNTNPIYAAARLWVPNATLKNPESYIPRNKYSTIHQAVVNTCDSIDGLKDGLIDDPRKCQFDPAVLQCRENDEATCLTAAQVEAARKIMTPVKHPRSGQTLVPALDAGAELGWGVHAGGPDPYVNLHERLKYVVFKDPNWDWRTFNLETDLIKLENLVDPANAEDPDLTAFASLGSKLLVYHGWADTTILPGSTIAYYESVLDRMGGHTKTAGWMRLFMAPGMAHCGGGEGPNTMDALKALEEWVERGTAPDQIIASHATAGRVDRTRPLCPYPQVARYKGSGSIDEASNFECRLP